jgi:nitrite reductase/ring-hydroxylating ferredoxin subunit
MTWHPVALIKDVGQELPTPVDIGDESIALYNIDGVVYATSNICTHQHAYLSDGYLDGDCIECPLHGGRFHVPTGEVRGGPVKDGLKSYPVKVEGEQVFVEM